MYGPCSCACWLGWLACRAPLAWGHHSVAGLLHQLATALKRTWWWPRRWPWTAGPATQAAQYSQPSAACLLFYVQVVAKALALECMRAAKAQERGCYVFAFAGPQEVRAGTPAFALPAHIHWQHKQGAPSFCSALDAGQGSTVLSQPS